MSGADTKWFIRIFGYTSWLSDRSVDNRSTISRQTVPNLILFIAEPSQGDQSRANLQPITKSPTCRQWLWVIIAHHSSADPQLVTDWSLNILWLKYQISYCTVCAIAASQSRRSCKSFSTGVYVCMYVCVLWNKTSGADCLSIHSCVVFVISYLQLNQALMWFKLQQMMSSATCKAASE